MLGDGGSYLIKGLSLGNLGKFPRRLWGGVVGVCFERRLKAAVKLFPAGGQDGLSLGGKGVISVLSNILPKETHDMVASYLDGDVVKSCEMQLKYFDLVKALFCEVNPIPVKKALNLMGMEVGSLRLPLTEMEDANAKRLEEEMRKAGVIK